VCSSDLYGALVVRNQTGEPFIPATTLAGLLRGIARHMAAAGTYGCKPPCLALDAKSMCGECVVCRVFGAAGDENARASAWEFGHARWARDESLGREAREVRDSVGIGRQSGAAATERLFAQEVVPKGAKFAFSSCLHAADEDEIALAIHCLDFWKEWGGRVGKASNSGLGKFRFDYCAEKLDLNDPVQLERYLFDDPMQTHQSVTVICPHSRAYEDQVRLLAKKVQDAAGGAEDNDAEPSKEARRLLFEAIRWDITLQPVGPLQIKTDFGADDDVLTVEGKLGVTDPFETDRPDSAFVRTGEVGCDSISEVNYIPGRSLKGVVRSHCERILRTRWALHNDDGVYLTHGATVVCDPNGSELPRLKPCGKDECRCPACELFGSTHYGGRVTVSEAFPVDASAFSERLKTLQRVSIDRITGGAADKRLFSGRLLFAPEKPDPKLAMNFSIEMECPDSSELGLMLFALRDLCKERLRVGFGKHVGQGKVAATITGCSLLTREGSPIHLGLPDEGIGQSDVGCLKLSRWSPTQPLTLEGWHSVFGKLSKWGTDGWTEFLESWAALEGKTSG